MDVVNVAEAKATLSAILRKVKAGETVVIAERNIPVAELRPVLAGAKRKRPLGLYAGLIHASPDAFAPAASAEAGTGLADLFSGGSSGEAFGETPSDVLGGAPGDALKEPNRAAGKPYRRPRSLRSPQAAEGRVAYGGSSGEPAGNGSGDSSGDASGNASGDPS